MTATDDKTQAEAKTLRLTQPASKLLFDYWNALRTSRVAPRRSEVDPAALRTLLPSVFILQRVDAEHVIFRVAGTALCAAFGRELREHNFIALWARDDRAAVRDLLLQLAARALVAVTQATGSTLDKRTVPAEAVLFPLADERGAHTRILGIASFGSEASVLGWRKLVRLDASALVLADPDRDRLVLDTSRAPDAPSPSFRLALVSPQPNGYAPAVPTLTNPWSEALRARLKLDS
jgi:hypothetical protein